MPHGKVKEEEVLPTEFFLKTTVFATKGTDRIEFHPQNHQKLGLLQGFGLKRKRKMSAIKNTPPRPYHFSKLKLNFKSIPRADF